MDIALCPPPLIPLPTEQFTSQGCLLQLGKFLEIWQLAPRKGKVWGRKGAQQGCGITLGLQFLPDSMAFGPSSKAALFSRGTHICTLGIIYSSRRFLDPIYRATSLSERELCYSNSPLCFIFFQVELIE